ncbi:phycocyanobilin:ferredoxin oxidoreductase [Prochlorococcus sp. MIT 0801]|uniref:phycocyanobilin:ferredoxin oxidoreductase n=1 Tax=Prochlorococcus sp. MIT 0801 TaxID=1501269 RepID=UPI002100F59A|nr:phycocyanobilin:ferredoxin oxidoreductase [Prochlorococcus sp. MIT 0801]
MLEAFKLIKNRINSLTDLQPLYIDPNYSKIYRNLNKEELFIINEFYRAKGFRKIHLEVAKLGKSLQILHCVFFPDPCYELPIFGADLVVNSNNISAGIVDLSPVGKHLPVSLISQMRSLKVPKFAEPGRLPEWGFIFSPYVCFIRPVDLLEEKLFLKLTDQYLSLILSLLVKVRVDQINSLDSIKRLKYQKRYCLNQKRNDKTRGILTKFFGSSWADEYINKILFEC